MTLSGLPEELQAISLSEAYPHLQMRPWEWDQVGVRWTEFLKIWASVQRDAKTLHRQLFG